MSANYNLHGKLASLHGRHYHKQHLHSTPYLSLYQHIYAISIKYCINPSNLGNNMYDLKNYLFNLLKIYQLKFGLLMKNSFRSNGGRNTLVHCLELIIGAG